MSILKNHNFRQKEKVIVVLGPTASGKSDLAVKLAKRFNGEIISADSRQVYKGLDIGSGKITKKEMGGIKHYLLDVASPKKTFTVARYQKLAKKAVRDILKKKKIPIICGGTGLYIDALIYDVQFPNVKPNPEIRKMLEKKSVQELFAMLKKLDPNRAKSIDPQNPRRLIRALEIVLSTGKPVPVASKEPLYDVLRIGITRSPDELALRIKKRLIQRLKIGMVKEVEKLKKSGVSWKKLDDLGLEYRYISRYLRGLMTKKEMTETLEKEIRNYAKRQMTWFKRDSEIHWVKNFKEAEKITKKFQK